ncbi:MAG: cobalamin biosynthesis protein CobD [Omnitrophica bacterium RIFCSPHIGHO2_02_FULL_46_11]|nr:MAG: cobalamin biosynthesis protein CobD [Omnitrophica bacterium RIFCSPLOWO2_01_FULL_45_10b]OGW86124.1 MAG: cobalamin biosynthesis protein CobD [Omnitrophica bacterium RIFCSPHIGHO2_02_FULL_46_11]
MVALAFLLDLWLGDPIYAFHPVRMMGHAIEHGEGFLRGIITHEKMAGAILSICIPTAVFLLAWSFILWLGSIHFFLVWAAQIFGIYSALSIHDLRKEGLNISQALKKNDLCQARKNLSRIVGRDTETLDQKEILRASIETIAESTVDGIIAPLFYAVIGGAPLALAYKAVNTLDSMIGHLNERYRDFGFFAAKQDELWNWIPARLSYFAIVLASFFAGGQTQQALRTGWQDGVMAGHGNSAIPEAAFAGALGLQLGGPSVYEGRFVEKPFLGSYTKNFDGGDLLGSIRLMLVASWISLLGMLLLKYGLGLVDQILK